MPSYTHLQLYRPNQAIKQLYHLITEVFQLLDVSTSNQLR